MPRRTALVTVSIAGHFAIGIGLFASGIWKLERLENDTRTAAIGIMTPVMGGGGNEDRPKQEFKKKERVEKKIAKDVQWDKRVETDKPVKALSDGESGNGEGPSTGDGDGPGDPNGNKDGTCVLPPCGPVVPEAEPVKLPDPPKVASVAPPMMAALRVRGETQIHPPRTVQTQMLREGNTRVVASIKVCIATSGDVSSVSMIGTTKYPEYDQEIVSTARRWQYRPYTVGGVPTAACSAVSFVYSIR